MITHRIALNTVDADFIREAWNVPNCRTVICKVREVRKNGKLLSRSQRYFISSLDASLGAKRFLTLARGHWQVEVRLHLIKDRWWEEDKHPLFRPGLGEIWATLTNIAVSLLWWGGEKGKSLARRAIAIANRPLQCLKSLGY